MKKMLISLFMVFPLGAYAQTEWDILEYEVPAAEKAETKEKKPKKEKKSKKVREIRPEDLKYMSGSVPVEDGRVVFRLVVDSLDKPASEIYDIVLAYLTKMTLMSNQIEQSRIAIQDPDSHDICGIYEEWLTFQDAQLVRDRTRFYYNILAHCTDGCATIELCRIHYLYDEYRNPKSFTAEQYITDEYALTNDKMRLTYNEGKFRKKTIERKDYIFRKISELLHE